MVKDRVIDFYRNVSIFLFYEFFQVLIFLAIFLEALKKKSFERENWEGLDFSGR